MKSLEIIIPGRPIPLNAIWRHVGSRTYLTNEARAYKERVAAHALAAARSAGWPKPETVKRCAVTIVVVNPHPLADVDGPAKLILDALEGIVFSNDRVARPLLLDDEHDDGEPRVRITVSTAT